MKKSRIYYEISAWAGRKRDGRIITPMAYFKREEQNAFREGYYNAMNEVAQHFNMERLKAEKEEERGTDIQS